MKIYNFGSLNIDYVYEVENMVRAGETISSLSFSKFMGGKGLNQSIALARAGSEVMHIGCIGEDGRFLVEKLKEEGVDVHALKTVNTPTGHAIIQLDSHGENSILLYAGANHCLEPDYIDSVFEMMEPDALILLQNEISNIDYIIEKAHGRGVAVAINLSPINENIKKIDLSKVSYLLINEVEGKTITGFDSPVQIGNSLIQKYPHLNVVLTLGAEGVIFFHQHEMIEQSAYKSNVVDTTGAGDTFTGYFLSMLMTGKRVHEALKIGCYASSLAIGVKGAANSIPKSEQVMKGFDR